MASIRDLWFDQNGKATARNGKGKRWLVRYWLDGERRSETFIKKGDATRFANRVETGKDARTWIDPRLGKMKVGPWADQWLKRKRNLRPTSRVRLEGIIETHIKPTFGLRSLSTITHAEICEWVGELENAGLRPGTVRKVYDAMRQLMKAALLDRRIPFNPCDSVELPMEDHREQRFLDTGEIDELVEAMTGLESRFRAFVLLGVYGGLRFGELGGLRRKRINIARGAVKVEEVLIEVNGELSFGSPKTKNSVRTVPLPRRVVKELEQHLAEYVEEDPESLVFVGPKGAPLRRAGFHRCWWAPATKRAGVEGLRVHDLRHTFVALWVDAGENLKSVSVRAGHSSVAFTQDRYGHLYEDREPELQDRLDALLKARQRAEWATDDRRTVDANVVNLARNRGKAG
jgi:integrase